MGAVTGIAWTEATFNPWEGCTNVGPGCDHCYAEIRNHRFKGNNWGPGAPRRRTSIHNWNDPIRWDRLAAERGRPMWVFCASLADVFDNEVDPVWRADLWNLIRKCRNLRWQLVTKRIGNVAKMVPEDWLENFGHVGIIATIVNQDEADRDMRKLRAAPAAWRGVSYEPALGAVDWSPWLDWLDWLIIGGESGAAARPFDPVWASSAVAQCRAAGVPAFVKQMGAKPVGLTLKHKKGEDPDEWPLDLQVREMPVVYEANAASLAS